MDFWGTESDQTKNIIGHPQITLGGIRSNLNFEVILKVKKAKLQNCKKNHEFFLAIFGKGTGHKCWDFAQYPMSVVSTLLFL